MSDAVIDNGEQVLMIERVFDAPREEVFKAWTDDNLLMQWFCSKGFRVVFADIDLRPGGAWRTGMESPEGKVFIEAGEYKEITPPERLVMTWAWEDAQGEECAIDHETLVTVTFSVHEDNKTKMQFKQEVFFTEKTRDGHSQGWSEAFDNLELFLSLEYMSGGCC